MHWWEIDLWLEWNTSYPHLLKLPQQFNKVRFFNPAIFLDGCERNAAVRLFRDTAQLLFRLFVVLGGIDTVQQLGKRNRVKVHHMQPVEKLMLLIFNLRAKLDKLAFPIFRFGQFSDFRTTKPQFQSKNMLVNLDIMPFLKLIRFIINWESTAFRLIFSIVHECLLAPLNCSSEFAYCPNLTVL